MHTYTHILCNIILFLKLHPQHIPYRTIHVHDALQTIIMRYITCSVTYVVRGTSCKTTPKCLDSKNIENNDFKIYGNPHRLALVLVCGRHANNIHCHALLLLATIKCDISYQWAHNLCSKFPQITHLKYKPSYTNSKYK